MHKWIPQIIGYSCKAVAIFAAYKIQVVISAFYAAIRGGLMVTRNLLRVLSRPNKVFTLQIDPDDTMADEYAGWVIAAFGFYVQFKLGFAAPWVVQLLLWPLGVCESTLTWAVFQPTPAPGAA